MSTSMKSAPTTCYKCIPKHKFTLSKKSYPDRVKINLLLGWKEMHVLRLVSKLSIKCQSNQFLVLTNKNSTFTKTCMILVQVRLPSASRSSSITHAVPRGFR